jgi:type IV secretion system protein VirB9
MNKAIFYLAVAGFLTSASPSLAMEQTTNSAYDHRMRHVAYNADDVTPLYGVVGIATDIELSPGETYEAHAFGDGQAWAFSHFENHIIIKPADTNGDTDLMVLTSKHEYFFHVYFIADHNSPLATYRLQFSYPDDDAQAVIALENKEQTDAAFRQAQLSKHFNTNYTETFKTLADRDLAPVNVWDDGTFTYFKFPGNTDLPAIFLRNADGSESSVNRMATGTDFSVVAVDKIGARWSLRLGTAVLGVYNGSYNPAGVASVTGTASPDVSRVLKTQGGDQ